MQLDYGGPQELPSVSRYNDCPVQRISLYHHPFEHYVKWPVGGFS
jgi:hypothetical protein